ncbi:MAG: hypothetical protein HY716_06475 [Planctomycetes bacterium]|nr:hypothetical protein [Planctomycetota bacterium]
MEIVLGIDNVVFLSILVGKLPPEKQRKVRLVGLALALLAQLALLFIIALIGGHRKLASGRGEPAGARSHSPMHRRIPSCPSNHRPRT